MKITCHIAADTIWPLRLQTLDKAAEITRRFVHVGLAHLDKAQPDDRVHLDLPVIGGLTHQLVMNLTFWWHINDHIGLQCGLAGQPPAGSKAFFVGIAGFNSGHTAQAVIARGDPVLGKFAVPHINLAASTQGPAAANRININTKCPRRLQHRCASRHKTLSPRRRKYDLDV